MISTSVVPSIPHYIARKSTVSRNSNRTIPNDVQEKPVSITLLPENEVEQMIVDSVRDIDDQIIHHILDEIRNQIDRNEQEEIHLERLRDIHQIVNRLIDQVEHDQHISDAETSMDSHHSNSMHSPNTFNDEMAEIENSSCTCQCHQHPSKNLPEDYLLFEHALQETRREQQRTSTNNRLLQTLKQQHEELMNFYQKQLQILKIDQEQQTSFVEQQDCQIQTDFTQPPPTTPKPNTSSTNGTAVISNQSTPVSNNIVPIRNYPNYLTPIRTTGLSLQQLIPCMTTVPATKTAPNLSIFRPIAPVPAPAPPLPPPPTLPTAPDIVDLTEDDDEEERNKNFSVAPPPPAKTTPIDMLSNLPLVTRPVINNVNTGVTNILPRSTSITPSTQIGVIRPLVDPPNCDHSLARPQLNITQDDTSVRLTWNLPSTLIESIQNYEIYAFKKSVNISTSDWKKIGTVKSMRLPMAVTLKEFQSNSHYAFAVRAISILNHVGPFCEPKAIYTGTSTTIQPLHTSHLLNQST